MIALIMLLSLSSNPDVRACDYAASVSNRWAAVNRTLQAACLQHDRCVWMNAEGGRFFEGRYEQASAATRQWLLWAHDHPDRILAVGVERELNRCDRLVTSRQGRALHTAIEQLARELSRAAAYHNCMEEGAE